MFNSSAQGENFRTDGAEADRIANLRAQGHLDAPVELQIGRTKVCVQRIHGGLAGG